MPPSNARTWKILPTGMYVRKFVHTRAYQCSFYESARFRFWLNKKHLKSEILMSPLSPWIRILRLYKDDCNDTKYNYYNLLWYDKNLGDGGFGVLLNCPLCHTPLIVTRYHIRPLDLFCYILACRTVIFVLNLNTKSLQYIIIIIINFSFFKWMAMTIAVAVAVAVTVTVIRLDTAKEDEMKSQVTT